VPRDSSLTLRPAQSRDARGVAAVHVGSWQAAYRGLVPEKFLDALDVDERANSYRFGTRGPDETVVWIVAQGENVVGFIAVGRCRDDDHVGAGEVWALYVAPTRWRSGIGSRLLSKGEELLAQRGFAEATLWVLERNAPARRFYESAGWHYDDKVQTIQVSGLDVTEVRYLKSLS
jgi:ribosomal protein S18 acetylase RimI-like enzyme